MDQLTAIAAVGANGVIGADGRLPWHIREDMRHFRDVTMDQALVMGRTTYESLGVVELSGRALFIASRHPRAGVPPDIPDGFHGSSTGVQWYPSLDAAIAAARRWASKYGRRVFIAGGEQIYRQAWPLLTDLELTLVDDAPPGDRRFPDVDPAEWDETARQAHDGFAFVHFRRRSRP